jgi:hypothetical protein
MRLIPWKQKETVMSDEANNELPVSVGRAEPRIADPALDKEREIMVAASAQVERWNRERAELKQMVEKANAGLDAKNEKIGDLHAQLEQERKLTARYRLEADDLVRENERLGRGLVHIRSTISSTLLMLVQQLDELGLPPAPEKRRRNRKSVGDLGRPIADPSSGGETLPDANGGPGEVAAEPPLVAHGK